MNAWLQQWYNAQASQGGVIRRKRTDVDKQSSLADVISDAQANGWHVIETGGQVVILCHQGQLVVHC